MSVDSVVAGSVDVQVCDEVKGTASPPDNLSYSSSAIVAHNTEHTKGRSAWLGVFGLKRTWDQKLSSGSMLMSYTSVSCSPVSSVLRHYGVFVGTRCSGDVCCGGFFWLWRPHATGHHYTSMLCSFTNQVQHDLFRYWKEKACEAAFTRFAPS